MKLIKSFFILLFGSILFMACSSNDNDEQTNVDDPILGTWNLKYQKIGSVIINDTDCHQQSYIKWNSDLTAERATYLNDGQGGDCYLYTSSNGTWELISEDESEFNDYNYRYTDSETGQGVEEEIIFVDDNNIIIDYGSIDFYYEKIN